jgi:hypothetical protein
MSTDHGVGHVVFYHDGEDVLYHDGEENRTLAIVHTIFYEKNELEIYYLDKNFDIHKKKVNIDNIRQAIRGPGSGIIDVLDKKYIDNKDHIKKTLIWLSDIDLNNFTEVNGGSRKTKRRKSKRRKTNRNRRHKK